MLDPKITLFLLVAAASVALSFVLGVALAVIMQARRKRRQKGETHVGFVVETFQDLVAELKEKERELEVLRAKAEARAGAMEDYNENILQSVPSGVISLDDSWRVVTANAAACRILGPGPEELAGRDLREIISADVLLKDKKRGETQFVTPRGNTIWLGYTLSPLVDAGGTPIGQLFVFTDLTELRALEAQAALRQRLSSLGEMSAGIAHELKNSMGVISGYMRMLAAKVEPDLAETVGLVSSEVATMDRIINDFLAFARPMKLSVSDMDLAELVAESVRAVLSGREDVEVNIELGDRLVVRADEVLLKQALLNLISNAAEAMPEGGTLSVSARSAGRTALITVSDTGHGIDEAIMDRIFLPFYTTKEKGTGLGLAIVHRIVSEHSGLVEARPRKGGGTEVRIRLPLGR